MVIRVHGKGLVWLVVFGILFSLALRTLPVSDQIVRAIFWSLLAGMSIAAVGKMIRQRRVGGYGQDALLPRRVRRWVLGDASRIDPWAR